MKKTEILENLSELENNLDTIEERLQSLGKNMQSLSKNRFWLGFFLGVGITATVFINLRYALKEKYSQKNENQTRVEYIDYNSPGAK